MSVHCERCDAGDEEPLHLVSRCHPEAGTDAVYFEEALHIMCHECNEHVTTFLIREDDLLARGWRRREEVQ